MKLFAIFLMTFVVFVHSDNTYGRNNQSCNRVCRRTDPKVELNKCMLKRARAAVRRFARGDEGYPELDPLEVDVLEGYERPAIVPHYSNVTIVGLNDLRMKKMKLNVRRLELTAKASTNLTLDGYYTLDAALLRLPISGEGRAHVELQNVKMSWILHHKIVNKSGVEYLEVTNHDIFEYTVGNALFDLENLYIEDDIITDESVRDGFRSLMRIHMTTSTQRPVMHLVRDRILETLISQYQKVPYSKLLAP